MAGALLLTLILAQAPPAAETAEAARLERIRKALAEGPGIAVLPAGRAQGTKFRITVFGGKPLPPLWVNWSAVPTNIRPWFRASHHEFLEQVTPEEFRGPALYPTGVPVIPLVEFLAKGISAANRKRQESNARDEVRKALEELLACRANPGLRPPTSDKSSKCYNLLSPARWIKSSYATSRSSLISTTASRRWRIASSK